MILTCIAVWDASHLVCLLANAVLGLGNMPMLTVSPCSVVTAAPVEVSDVCCYGPHKTLAGKRVEYVMV